MTPQNLSSFIWSIAELLRGDYKQSDYGKVILPFTVLRRLDCALGPSKLAALEEHQRRIAQGLDSSQFLPRIVARPTTELNSSYFELILRTPSCIEQMRRMSKGIVDFRQRLYWEEFKELRIPYPPHEEQNSILTFVDFECRKIGDLIDKANQSINLMKERRSALISAAVTGKIDVREAVAAR